MFRRRTKKKKKIYTFQKKKKIYKKTKRKKNLARFYDPTIKLKSFKTKKKKIVLKTTKLN